jgi:hypothetical protein
MSISSGAATSSIIMYVRSSSKAASRSLSAAPSATAWLTAWTVRLACTTMMAAWAAMARERSATCLRRTT